MIITELPIGELIPYENNPRKNDSAVEVVAHSIQEFGFKIPVIIDAENVIVCGHTRVKAAKKLGLKTIPCLRADDLTEDQIKAFRLADNKTAEYAEWDFEKLEVELKGIDFDMTLFDFEPPETEVADDDFDLEEALDEIDDPVTQNGDVWLLGHHRLACGDSTKPSDMDKLMDNQQADLVLTDPPYNVDYEGGTKDKLKIQNDKMNDDKFLQFLTDAFTRMHEHSKKGAAIYVFHADSEGYNFRNAFKLAGYSLRQCLVWAKNSLVLGRQDYQWQHEPILYGWKDGASHVWYGDRKQTTLIKYDKPQRNADHPTMKPVGLCGYFIANSSKEGDIVLDPFGGSGSTLMACEQNGRSCYTMEMDPKYCDVIVHRYEELTGQKAQRIGG
ncbi:DNA modification methylase [Desulfosporosinus sp.]|uniref:DNA modification methylase n=1 Tax=Desulfosporosinus sp. TaxID=157907 RepID=UPI0025BE132E|nr:DNA modification methylase [Desulfosporosinus sp.]MBC2722022.1 ParB N-terminal domain-containing protein [Desulfosporosinus sp.]MBC2728005.1 ParB N-terminal domain-containing protein [Desulfosporosinus sp.]